MAPPIPIIILYTQDTAAIEGATRFQKLVFLAQEETRIPERYNYEPDKFGPYSWELESDLERVIEQGFVERNVDFNSSGNPRYKYSLTVKGIREAKNLLGRFDPLFEELDKVKSRYNDQHLGDLLRYVYGQYPEYTTESDLDLDRLFDPEAPSQFHGTDEEFVGEYNYLETLDRAVGEITSSEESFERISVNTLRDKRLQIEKFEHGRIAVYWTTDASCSEFIGRLDSDSMISADSFSEVRIDEEWFEDTYDEISSMIHGWGGCQFLAVASERQDYEVTWERNVMDEGDLNEITILFLPEEGVDSTIVRSTLSTYLSQEIGGAGRNGPEVVNDDVRQSIWETTKFILA